MHASAACRRARSFRRTACPYKVSAVVVKRRAPEQAAGGHHAGLHRAHFRSVAARAAASLRRDAQVAGIDEAHVLGALAQPIRVGALRIGRSHPRRGSRGSDMRLRFGLLVRRRFRVAPSGRAHARVAAMAIRAAQPHRAVGMHGRLVGCRVAVTCSRRFWRRLRPASDPSGSRPVGAERVDSAPALGIARGRRAPAAMLAASATNGASAIRRRAGVAFFRGCECVAHR